MHPRCVQIAEHTKILEVPAADRGANEDLSSKVVSGKAFVSLTSVDVSLLTNISSPFHAVCKTSPGGSSEISSSLYVSLIYLHLVIIC
jgi:hypothetical protein